jgi:hypothetical protein
MRHFSNRYIQNDDGSIERVEVDATPGADNSRANGYDPKPGRAFNAKKRHSSPAKKES